MASRTHSGFVIAATALLFLALCLLISSLYIKSEREDFAGTLRQQMMTQRELLREIATRTDEEVLEDNDALVVRDCSPDHRTRFDGLLDSLAVLSADRLQDANVLFDACGGYFAQKKALLIMQLEDTHDHYVTLAQMLIDVDPQYTTESLGLEDWSKLVAYERERSQLHTQLVDIQREIISELMSGSTVQSERVQQLLQDASHAKDLLQYTNTQVDALKEDLADV